MSFMLDIVAHFVYVNGDDVNWRFAFYGRRIIDACFATLFAAQSTLSLNRSIAIGLCSITQDQYAATIDSIAADFFVLLSICDSRMHD